MELDHGIIIPETIDLHQDPDIIFWTTRWNVTEADLKEAYRITGNLNHEVIYRALQEMGRISPDQTTESQ